MRLNSLRPPVLFWWRFLQIVTLVTALALYASMDGADEVQLRWLLAPSVSGIETLNGMEFGWTGSGYTSQDGSIVIDRTCAGLRFFFVCWCIIALGFSGRVHNIQVRIWLCLLAPFMAYPITVMANAIRIFTSVALMPLESFAPVLAKPWAHAAEGVFCYMIILAIFYSLLDYTFRQRAKTLAQ